jgi:hypothetical protein
MNAIEINIDDFDARYAVATYPGVAFYLVGYVQTREECQGHPAEDCGDEHAALGEVLYCDGSCEEPHDDTSQVRAIMVGDDREHIVDVEDLKLIGEGDYCPGCGQIGCGHYVV